MSELNTSRRRFLASASAAAATPYFFSTPRTLADETRSAVDRLKVGVIGCGGIARANMWAFRDYADVVAVCDVDSQRTAEVQHEFGKGIADTYSDYRHLLDRDDLDAVHVATPDHWHAKPVVEAMLAGHDVYCEKPLTLTIDEGKLIRRTQRETRSVVQVGTQQRSMFDRFVAAIALVKSGRLGKIMRIETGIGAGSSCEPLPVAAPPAHLDWDRWLGPAPHTDFRFLAKENGDRGDSNCHYNFRWWYQYSGGKLTDWGAHHVDIAAWALEANGQPSIPSRVRGTAEHPVDFEDGAPMQRDRYNTATRFDLYADMPDGAELYIRSHGRNGVLIEAENGRVFVNRENLTGVPIDALRDGPLPEEALDWAYKGAPRDIQDARTAHWVNFFRCIRDRTEPISDVHSHMRALTTCHLAGISARLGREVTWDANAERITGDELANSMLGRPYRSGYEIDA